MNENASVPVRVRFAPSPTGLLHIGGVRTALFNYLFARRHKGQFILRLEDTDRERFVAEGVEQIQQGLAWLGLTPDEGYWLGEHKGSLGPYLQSERLPHYECYAQQLVEHGLAYYSYITPDDFEARKQAAIAAKKPFVYRQEFEPQHNTTTDNKPIRLKIKTGKTSWEDEVRGSFDTSNELIDDFVIMKADGFPTYNFANVIDDHLMQISHVIRGDEFISSTAKHALLYDYFDWVRPKWAHLPLILAADGKKKLSKRDGEVNLLDYRDQGYLAAALLNFLALLGWNDGTEEEIFSLSQLCQKFELSRVQLSPAIFDINRLDWMNGEYIRKLTPAELAELLHDYVPAEWYENRAYFQRVVALDQERLKQLGQAKDMLEFFFVEPKLDQALLTKKSSEADVRAWLTATYEVLEKTEFDAAELEPALRELASKLAVSVGQLFYVIRVAITGRTEAPGLFDTLAVLGPDKSLARIQTAIGK